MGRSIVAFGGAPAGRKDMGHGNTVLLIRDQKRHHRTMTFQEEFVLLLDKNAIIYDGHYVWT